MVTLPKKLQPEIWFVESVRDGGKVRVRALANQFIPFGESDDIFVNSDCSLWVQCDRNNRGTQVGVKFAVKKLRRVEKDLKGGGTGRPYYNTHPEPTLYPIDSPSTPPEFKQAYLDWTAGKTPKISPPARQSKIASGEAKPKSLLDKLLHKYPVPTPANNGFYVDPIVWSRVVIGMEKKHNLMLQGDSGCGKTELCYLLAKQFGLSLEMFDMGSKQDPIASLIGSHRYNAAKGGSYFDRASFTKAIQSKSLVLLDELSRAPALTNNILLPVLDSRKTLQMDLATSEEESFLKVNNECQFIATANVGFEYSGTQPLDRALEERFRVIKMDYPPEAIEAEILRLKTNVSKRPSETIVKVANTIRDLNRKGELSKGVSLRHTLDAAELEEGGFELKTALELAFLPAFQFSEEEKVLEILASR